MWQLFRCCVSAYPFHGCRQEMFKKLHVGTASLALLSGNYLAVNAYQKGQDHFSRTPLSSSSSTFLSFLAPSHTHVHTHIKMSFDYLQVLKKFSPSHLPVRLYSNSCSPSSLNVAITTCLCFAASMASVPRRVSSGQLTWPLCWSR